MSILVQEKEEIIKVIVETLENKIEIDKLLDILDNIKKIEISFLNIKILPKEVVLKLQNYKSNIQIFTNELVLKSYLMNLGFNLSFTDSYKNQKTKDFNLHYLALGGSAGSLEKFIEIVSSLPPSNISVFIIMHQRGDLKSNLTSILQKYTKDYEVLEAESDMQIKPATIYTAPPNKHMIIIGEHIFLTDSEKRNFSKPSISTTFESLSSEYKNSLLCVLLCGYGNDGSDSLKHLQENQSTIIVEGEDECEAKMMLQSAVKTGIYDYIFSSQRIKEFISSNINQSFFNDEELEIFLENVYKKYDYDYRGYSINHIKRRVELFYIRLNLSSFKEFEQKVLEDIDIFKDLFLNISVNITTFYRNPELFKYLKKELLPKLDSFLDIRIWCAGCSSGEEPYSLAIFLKELGLYDKSTIYATDINSEILKSAKNGFYSKENYDIFLKNYYKAGGNESFSSYFNDYGDFVEVKDEIKKNILFFKHNLVKGGKINDFQVIFCRNVMIYFDRDLKMKVFDLFYESMDNFSFLVLGESESLKKHENYDIVDEKNKIYKRKI